MESETDTGHSIHSTNVVVVRSHNYAQIKHEIHTDLDITWTKLDIR